MLEEKIDKAANGIKKGIGWVREHKNKLIGGGLAAAGVGAGIGIASLLKHNSDDDYLYLEDEYDECYEDSDLESDQDESEEVEIVEVTVEEVAD